MRGLVDFRQIRSIAILVFPDVEEFDFIGVYEVLNSVNRMMEEGKLSLDKPLSVEVVASESPVSCRNGLRIIPNEVSEDFTPCDVLIVPGGRGIRPLMKNPALLQRLRQFAENHVICSVCTGSLLLGAAGILEGKRAVTHHWHLKELEAYAALGSGRVYVDGGVITSAGISSTIDLGLKLTELIYDETTARRVVERLELPASYWPSA